MTKYQFKETMENVAIYFFLNDYLKVCRYLNVDNNMTDGEVFKKLLDEISSSEVYEYLISDTFSNTYLKDFHCSDEFPFFHKSYILLGCDIDHACLDNVINSEYLTLISIATNSGKLTYHKAIHISIDELDYDNLFFYETNAYKYDSEIPLLLNILTSDEKSPLHKYDKFFDF